MLKGKENKEHIRVEERDGLYIVTYSNSPEIYSFGETEIEALQNLVYELEEELECVDL